jgi:hypothetical protein
MPTYNLTTNQPFDTENQLDEREVEDEELMMSGLD